MRSILFEGKFVQVKNCYELVAGSDDFDYEWTIFYFFLAFIANHFLALLLAKIFGHPLSTRPTVIGSTVHGIVTSIASITILLLGTEYYYVWQRVVIPFSIGYFLADILVYCIPKRDLLITVHHLTVILCHYPVGENMSAQICCGGDREFCVWLSMTGYTSEFAVPLLSTRWWLSQTLKQHIPVFAMLGVSIMTSFLTRCAIMVYLVFQVVTRYDSFVELEQSWAFMVIFFGHVTVFFMSLHWLRIILQNGMTEYLQFKKREGESKGFSFQESITNVRKKPASSPAKEGVKQA
jgi:hypothetical protein